MFFVVNFIEFFLANPDGFFPVKKFQEIVVWQKVQ